MDALKTFEWEGWHALTVQTLLVRIFINTSAERIRRLKNTLTNSFTNPEYKYLLTKYLVLSISCKFFSKVPNIGCVVTIQFGGHPWLLSHAA